jgi:hypothetical protein
MADDEYTEFWQMSETSYLLETIEESLRVARIDTAGLLLIEITQGQDALAELRRRLSDEEAERLRGELARVRVEAAQARHDALSHAVRRATGCLDYLGGLTGPGSEALLREYHAGMQCVIRVLEGLRDGEDTTQTRALDAIGGAR